MRGSASCNIEQHLNKTCIQLVTSNKLTQFDVSRDSCKYGETLTACLSGDKYAKGQPGLVRVELRIGQTSGNWLMVQATSIVHTSPYPPTPFLHLSVITTLRNQVAAYSTALRL
ncbi:hypothetical protein J6590_104644 [Homalodisca vitripennis]|nr:hypothetical protein J6590_104644 [Homalodisca vitripennis]